MDCMDDTTTAFLAFSRKHLSEIMWPRLKTAIQPLSRDQIWWRPNEASNSIGNLLLHLNGNIRQWILSGIGEIEFVRNRDAEFDERQQLDTAVLLARLGQTIQEAVEVLNRVAEHELLRVRIIQGYEVSGLVAISEVVQHFAMHYGQILYIVKMLQANDLGFYAHLNKRTEVE
jgi:uncharacterized damage-inducible protein DinB